MPNNTYSFIINPAAGGHSMAGLAEIQSFCRQQKLKYDIHVTDRPGHAIDLARQAAKHGGTVVAVGGDGTVNEVVNGIVGTPARLGILPAGSGNDLAWQMGLKQNLQKNLQTLIDGQVRTMDVGQINGQRYFVNGFGAGFDGEVAGRVRAYLRHAHGYTAYLMAALRTLATYRFRSVRLTIDNHVVRDQPLFFVSCCNGTTYGGGFKVAPSAKLDDGLLTICAVDKVSRLYALRNLPKFTRGTHLTLPEVHTYTGRQIIIESDQPQPAQADGELLVPAEKFTVDVTAMRLPVIAA